MAIALLQAVADQLKLGEPLKFSVLDDAGNLLLAQGMVLSQTAQLELLLARGQLVEFDEPEEDDDPNQACSLFERWERCAGRLDRLLGSLGKAGFPARCHGFADQLMALVARDPDIALYTTMRQDPAQFIRWGLNHALHCAVLAQLAATRIGWPTAQVACLVRAALTMNLGIIPIQGLLAHGGKVTEGQRERITNHPTLACERLRAAGVEDSLWLRAVQEHHEREGGGGYPEGIQVVSEMAQGLGLIDAFFTKISPHAGRRPMPVQEAAKQLLAEARSVPLAAGVIKEFGILPPGVPVVLASGEVAIVTRRGAKPNTPLAAAVTNERGKPVVTTHLRDTALPAYAIRAVEPNSALVMRIPPERLYGLVA